MRTPLLSLLIAAAFLMSCGPEATDKKEAAATPPPISDVRNLTHDAWQAGNGDSLTKLLTTQERDYLFIGILQVMDTARLHSMTIRELIGIGADYRARTGQ